MIYPRTWRFIPSLLIGGSVTLHLICLVLYTRLPDRFAAFTTFPIWVWGFFGLAACAFAYLFYKARLSLFFSVVWLFTLFLLADESLVIGSNHGQGPQSGRAKPFQGSPTIRVATLNCAGQANFEKFLAGFQPDIVFLQEIPHSYLLKNFTDTLYNGQGDYRYNNVNRCAVIVRGTLDREIKVPNFRSQHLTTTLPDGRKIQVVNLHLQAASTNLRLWTRDCWREHRTNRQLRRLELSYALGVLQQKTAYPRIPALVAGDFNAPANDAVYQLLKPDFVDAFNASGSGWGNTFHRAAPLLRIDHIFASKQRFIPVRSRAFTIPDSDHRLLIADFILK